MEDVTTPVLSGILVLLAGLLAFIVVSYGDPDGPSLEGQMQASAGPAATYSDLDPEVERVLLDSGGAWIYHGEVQAGIPEELTRVLDAYQVTLMIPVGEGR
jgi:hypothetical protein